MVLIGRKILKSQSQRETLLIIEKGVIEIGQEIGIEEIEAIGEIGVIEVIGEIEGEGEEEVEEAEIAIKEEKDTTEMVKDEEIEIIIISLRKRKFMLTKPQVKLRQISKSVSKRSWKKKRVID